jgi:hypothetical protein
MADQRRFASALFCKAPSSKSNQLDIGAVRREPDGHPTAESAVIKPERRRE